MGPDLLHLYHAGHYQDVIAALSGEPQLDARALAVLGVSLLRTGEVRAAQDPLEAAWALGEPEAGVEYGNWLRATGRFEDARIQFEAVLPTLEGDLKHRARRWLGVTCCQSHRLQDGLRLLEQARRGYALDGNPLDEAKTLQNLALIYHAQGEARRATWALERAVTEFRRFGSATLLLQGLVNLIHLLSLRGDDGSVTALLQEASDLLGPEVSPAHLMVWAAQARRLEPGAGRGGDYEQLLDLIYVSAGQFGSDEYRAWAAARKGELMLGHDDLAGVGDLIAHMAQGAGEKVLLPLKTLRAILLRRRGQLADAVLELQAVAALLEMTDDGAELTRVRLHLAYALHLGGQAQACAAVLRAALQGLLNTELHADMRPELEEMSELLQFAASDPDLRPHLEPVADLLAGVLARPAHPGAERLQVQVSTLGATGLLLNRRPLDVQHPESVPLLVFLAMTPNRTRQELQLALYPHLGPELADAAIRRGLWELRALLGPAAVQTEGPRSQPRYRLSPLLELDLDLTRFQDALERGETARATALYRGEFLPGETASPWVRRRREETRGALLSQLHTQMVAHREKREWRRVILLAGQALRLDARQMDIHDLRIEAARRAGFVAELGQYEEALNVVRV